jgi:peptidyl-prolyl cis-trans isomerase B (cyclophilin B)
MGLGDDQGVDDAFGRLLTLAPSKTTAGLAWTDYWLSRDSAHAIAVLEGLVQRRPDALLYLDRLFRSLAADDPARIVERFKRLGGPGGDRQQCGRELDILARVSGGMAAMIGSRLRVAWPDDLDIAIATARGYRNANRFGEARRLLDSIPAERMTDPAHVYLWSDTYYADHHFDRALELLKSIDMEALAEADRPGLFRRLGFMIPVRQTAADMWPAEQQRRLDDAARNDNPLAVLTINGREIVMELFEDDAPNTVAAFIAAADLGIYDGHEAGQVHPGFRTIFGDRHEEDGYSSWSLPAESYQQAPRPILAGNLVGYSDSKPGSADTRFFILQFPAPHLNERKTTFGRVLTGLDVLREMVQGDVLDSVEIIRRRDHAYDPDVFDADLKPMKLSEVLAAATSSPHRRRTGDRSSRGAGTPSPGSAGSAPASAGAE